MHRSAWRAPVSAAAVAAVLLAGCSAGGPSATRDEPARGAAESPGTIGLTVRDGTATETWPRVPGADGYVLTAGGAATVHVSGNRTDYRWGAPEIPSDLTTASVAPRRYTVTATRNGTALRRFTHIQDCASLIYVAARGSGQNGLLSDAYAGGLGSRGVATLENLRRDLGRDAWSMPAIAVDYPATAVAFGTDLLSIATFFHDYDNSVRAGVADTVRIVTQTAMSCHNSRFVLFGYSQGAQVIGSAYAALPQALRDRVADVILFADAQYRPHDPRVRYLPSALSFDGILGARGAFPAGGSTVIQSWCWTDDAVCQQPPHGVQFHGSVYDQYEVAAAQLTARELR